MSKTYDAVYSVRLNAKEINAMKANLAALCVSNTVSIGFHRSHISFEEAVNIAKSSTYTKLSGRSPKETFKGKWFVGLLNNNRKTLGFVFNNPDLAEQFIEAVDLPEQIIEAADSTDEIIAEDLTIKHQYSPVRLDEAEFIGNEIYCNGFKASHKLSVWAVDSGIESLTLKRSNVWAVESAQDGSFYCEFDTLEDALRYMRSY